MNQMQQMLKQAQKMQKEMEKMQSEMAEKQFTAQAGGDMVTATVNGKMELQQLKIGKEIVDPEDIEMLEDLVLSAVNSAIKEANDAMQGGLKDMTGGLNIPGMNL